MNQEDEKVDQTPAESLADLEVSADQANETNGGTGKVASQDVPFKLIGGQF